ncbi:hypothetical protein T265_02311 [Opisthorchis viverrini]|uniref:Uncharacterized protein n=1 Tax=Opisthorchis viverrini TaxID=6198 RepID=A0A074ZV99_OPIVI|nr:hypothetical protein T265_02311 [Opisthorchis viverrini]KER31393.1 hypothetical protein T265_02311 [Opisthorchis viverrini]
MANWKASLQKSPKPAMPAYSLSKFCFSRRSSAVLTEGLPRARSYGPAVAPIQCLIAMPSEGSTRAGILPGCPSLDRGSREAEAEFEPRTFRSVNSRSNNLTNNLAFGQGNMFFCACKLLCAPN